MTVRIVARAVDAWGAGGNTARGGWSKGTPGRRVRRPPVCRGRGGDPKTNSTNGSCWDDPLARLPRDLGDPVEVTVVVQHDEPVRLRGGGQQEVREPDGAVL